ncbi:MAG: DUF4127 family protein [bacterium]|nr:DUF4127 family protein [bacterium]
MKICFIPIDNRPVCYNLAKDICAIDEDIELLIPPKEYLGSLTKTADRKMLIKWISELPNCDVAIISLDTIAYGGLIPSRRSNDTYEEIKSIMNSFRNIIWEKCKNIYAFSSIMRISNNNCNEEEKEYWEDFGKKIFEYSYNMDKNGIAENNSIPENILGDYLNTRNRNFNINRMYLNWQKDKFFNTLIFSKDDCAEYGLNVQEARELEKLGGQTKTGADEIPLSLLARAINKDLNVFIEYTEPEYKDKISNYEDVSIEKSIIGQLNLGGFNVVNTPKNADLILIVNNFIKKQGELVMGWDTEPFDKTLDLPQKPYAIADVRYANGGDNAFVEQLLDKIKTENFYGYSGWNTSANTLGSLLACTKVKYNAKKYNNIAFKKLQIIRFLDDWAYQANVRGQIEKPCDIKTLMKPYEKRLSQVFDSSIKADYAYPWNRKFEVEVCL